MSLSVVINTKNSQETLERCLKSVSFADEIIVVDMASTDKTVAIAKKFTKKVFSHKDVGYVEPARNFALSKATQDWILLIDADEEIQPSLVQMINKIVLADVGEILQADCYYLPRKNMIFGRWIQHTGWWPDYVLRLFKKGTVDWPETIHAVPITKGEVRELPALEELAIIHHNYQNVTEFVNRLNRYTSIQAAEQLESAFEDGIDPEELFSAWQDEFLARLFAHRGYADGSHGFVLSMLQASSELVKAAKIWEQRGKRLVFYDPTHLLRHFQRDLNYWLADYQVKHTSGWKKWWWKLRRKLRA